MKPTLHISKSVVRATFQYSHNIASSFEKQPILQHSSCLHQRNQKHTEPAREHVCIHLTTHTRDNKFTKHGLELKEQSMAEAIVQVSSTYVH